MSANPSGSRGQLASGAYVDYVSSPLDPDEPTNVETYTYAGGSKYGIQWTNNSRGYTQYSLDGGSSVEGEVAWPSTSIEGFSTPVTGSEAVRHRLGSRYSAWVLAVGIG
jgi:hypothetical protein